VVSVYCDHGDDVGLLRFSVRWLVRLERYSTNDSSGVFASVRLVHAAEAGWIVDPQIIAIILSLLINVPTWYMLKANRRKVESETDSGNIKDAMELKRQYKEDLKEIRAELERERVARVVIRDELEKEKDARGVVEDQLNAARVTIAELQDRDNKREAAMSDLKMQFDRDSLLRANVEKALALAHEKIASLELSNQSMSERISTLENERKAWRNGIKVLIDQVVKHGEEPAWRPPETQPLGKLQT